MSKSEDNKNNPELEITLIPGMENYFIEAVRDMAVKASLKVTLTQTG